MPPKRNSCAPKKESLAFNWELVSVIANTSLAMANRQQHSIETLEQNIGAKLHAFEMHSTIAHHVPKAFQ